MRESGGCTLAGRGAGGSSFSTAAIASAGVAPPKARRPVSISWRIAPTLKMSDRWSTGSPRTCSGDM